MLNVNNAWNRHRRMDMSLTFNNQQRQHSDNCRPNSNNYGYNRGDHGPRTDNYNHGALTNNDYNYDKNVGPRRDRTGYTNNSYRINNGNIYGSYANTNNDHRSNRYNNNNNNNNNNRSYISTDDDYRTGRQNNNGPNASRSRSRSNHYTNTGPRGNNHADNNYNSYNDNRSTNNKVNIQSIVEAVIRRMSGDDTTGNNGPKRLHRQQQRQQRQSKQQQQPQQRQQQPHRRGNSVHFRIDDEEHQEQSNNPEFHEVWKTLFKVVQLEYHLKNWDNLPPSLQKGLDHMACNITPPDPDDGLAEDIAIILDNAG